MLSALTWIPRGSCKKVPIRQEISKDEIEAITRAKQEDMDDFDNEEGDNSKDKEDEEAPSFAIVATGEDARSETGEEARSFAIDESEGCW